MKNKIKKRLIFTKNEEINLIGFFSLLIKIDRRLKNNKKKGRKVK